MMSHSNQGPYLGQRGQQYGQQYADDYNQHYIDQSQVYDAYSQPSSGTMAPYQNASSNARGHGQYPLQNGGNTGYNTQSENIPMNTFTSANRRPGGPQSQSGYAVTPYAGSNQYGQPLTSQSVPQHTDGWDESNVYPNERTNMLNPNSKSGGDISQQMSMPSSSRANLVNDSQPNSNVPYPGAPAATKRPQKSRKKWLIPLLAIIAICVILAAVLGGVLGSRASHHNNSSKSASGASGIGIRSPTNNDSPVFPTQVTDAANKAATSGKGDKLGYTSTDVYGNPLYTSDASTATPSSGGSIGNCTADPWKATNNVNNVRPGHPRLIAPQYLWDCLDSKIQNDAYLAAWDY